MRVWPSEAIWARMITTPQLYREFIMHLRFAVPCLTGVSNENMVSE